MKFSEYDLRAELLQAIQEVGYTDCTPIQDAVMHPVLKGKDVSGLAQTGTGKTAAFVIPLIDRIIRFKSGEVGERVPTNWKKNSFVLVLVPTRELATQVEAAVAQFGKNAGIRSTVVVGGSAYDEQKKALQEGVEFVVGTPGRLLDLYKSHNLDLNSVGAIVFDEADRMFDMGFKDDMVYILKRVPRDRQFLLFSATLNFEVLNTSYQFGAEPIEFNVSRDQVTAEGIDHQILHVGQEDKPMYLLSILKRHAPLQCIVFSNFKNNVGRIAKFLKNNGIEAMQMSSLLSQTQRNRVLESFRAGKKQILVATDVAARGLDIKGVDLVINFDLPDEAQGYVHRIGRTGRAGTQGHAVGLVSDRDVDALMRIEEYLKEKVKIGWLEDNELIKEFQPFPQFDDEERPSRGGGRFQRDRSGPGQQGGRGPRPPRSHEGRPRRGRHQGPQQGAAQEGNPPPQQRQHHRGANGHQPDQAPPGRQDRHRDRHVNREARRPDAHGQTADSRDSNVLNQHRDRITGRHGGVPGVRDEGNRGRGEQHRRHASSRSDRNDRGHSGRPDFNGQPPKRRPLKHSKTEAKKPGVVSAVKGFFSKLFK